MSRPDPRLVVLYLAVLVVLLAALALGIFAATADGTTA